MTGVDANELCDQMLQPYVFGERVDLRNHQVHGPVKITDASLCGVDLSGSVFNDSVEFNSSVFQGLAWFKDVEFHASVSFAGSRFSSDARFDNAKIIHGADFSSAIFWGVGCFDGVQAQGHVDMSGVVAYGNLSLAGSDFSQDLQLKNSVLMGGLWMPQCSPEALQGMDNCDVLGRIETTNSPGSTR